MATRPSRILSCGCRVAYGETCEHQRASKVARWARHDAKRASSSRRGYGQDWQRASRAFLLEPENYYCACGCGRRADTVDHIQSVRSRPDLRMDRSNWRPMAFGCHSRMTNSKKVSSVTAPRGAAKMFAKTQEPSRDPRRAIFSNSVLRKGHNS